MLFFFFFFKQKTAYEMRISDWSSDVCSSDLPLRLAVLRRSCRSRRYHLRRWIVPRPARSRRAQVAILRPKNPSACSYILSQRPDQAFLPLRRWEEEGGLPMRLWRRRGSTGFTPSVDLRVNALHGTLTKAPNKVNIYMIYRL